MGGTAGAGWAVAASDSQDGQREERRVGLCARRGRERRRKVREEGVSEVEAPRLAAREGLARLGRESDSAAAACLGTLRGVHKSTHTRPSRLAPASCTGTPAHTPVPTCAR